MVCVPRSSFWTSASDAEFIFLNHFASFCGLNFHFAFGSSRAVLRSPSKRKDLPATGSWMTTRDFACPVAAKRPIARNVTSLRKRPWLSRYKLVCVFRVILLPSERVCVLSETAVAVNGEPVTTFPPCTPPNPSSSILSPKNGPAPGSPASGPCPRAMYFGVGSGLTSCAAAGSEKSTIALATPRYVSHRDVISILKGLIDSSSPFSSLLTNFLPRACRLDRILMQAYRFRDAVFPDQQVHLNPVGNPILIHRQAERAQRPTLHSHLHHRSVFRLLRDASRQQRERTAVVVRQQNILRRGIRRCRNQRIVPHGELLARLPPVVPGQARCNDGRSGNRPRRGHRNPAPHHNRTPARTEFLPEPDFQTRSRLCLARVVP